MDVDYEEMGCLCHLSINVERRTKGCRVGDTKIAINSLVLTLRRKGENCFTMSNCSYLPMGHSLLKYSHPPPSSSLLTRHPRAVQERCLLVSLCHCQGQYPQCDEINYLSWPSSSSGWVTRQLHGCILINCHSLESALQTHLNYSPKGPPQFLRMKWPLEALLLTTR